MSDQQRDLWIGFDLGGTKMLACVFDSEFKQLGRARKKTKGREGMQAGLKRINNTIEEALEDAKVSADRVGGLGLAPVVRVSSLPQLLESGLEIGGERNFT